jgi:hypothetical protein
LALVRLDRLLGTRPILAEAFSGEQAHGGDEPGIPEEPLGSIEQPVSFRASDGGTAFVTSLLEGVPPERLRSGVPEYVHLHAVRPGGRRRSWPAATWFGPVAGVRARHSLPTQVRGR